jgi:hypothetical protein
VNFIAFCFEVKMLITAHWSVTQPPNPIGDYHAQYAQIEPVDLNLNRNTNVSDVDWEKLKAGFSVYKVMMFDVIPTYATYLINHDPRDQSADIAIASLSMYGATITDFGKYPFTYNHAFMMAGCMARVAYLKNIDTEASFDVSVEPDILQNGPIYNLSTHAERALQTTDQGQDSIPELGYFLYSGDGDCRWDIAVLDPSEIPNLQTQAKAVQSAKNSAAWLRMKAHKIKLSLNSNSDMWGLDKNV